MQTGINPYQVDSISSHLSQSDKKKGMYLPMGIIASNPCPHCHQYPDIPSSIDVSMWFSSPSTWEPYPYEFFYCNRCGTKLVVALTDEGIKHVLIELHGSEDEFYEDHDEPGLTVLNSQVNDDDDPEDYTVDLWQPPERRAFISYSHLDRVWCSSFAESLRSHQYNVFQDQGNIASGVDWVRAIEEAIENSQYFIIILTPDAWASEWVQRELSMAFAAQRELIPIMLSLTTITGFLRSIQWIDARTHTPEEVASIVVEKIQAMNK